MPPRAVKWLSDIHDACAFLEEIAAGSTRERFAEDRLTRNAAERNFEIIGEALLQLERTEPTVVARISDYRAVIGLRNRLVHGYDDVDSHRLWHIMTRDLLGLQAEVAALLTEMSSE